VFDDVCVVHGLYISFGFDVCCSTLDAGRMWSATGRLSFDGGLVSYLLYFTLYLIYSVIVGAPFAPINAMFVIC
jgi:hypothetical protein